MGARAYRKSNGGVPRLASGAAQAWEEFQSCCCGPAVCNSCCFQVTLSGLSFVTTALYAEVDQFFDYDSTVQTGTDQGTLNGTFIVCDNDPIPYALRVEYTENGNDVGSGDFSACGYVYVAAIYNPFTQMIDVVVRIPLFSVPNEEDQIFAASVSLTPEQIAIIEGVATCDGFGTAESDNSLGEGTFYPFNNASGTVTIGLVPTCNGANPPFVVDCGITPTGFYQTICDDEDCPCGRTDAQPVCITVAYNNSAGVPVTYGFNVPSFGGTSDRNYVFVSPRKFDNSGTPWLVIIVRDDADGAAAYDEDGAYLGLQCVGDFLDNIVGTFTMLDAADFPSPFSTVLTNHQTTLANLSTVTTAICGCVSAADVYTLSIQCEIGTEPADWLGDITLTRTSSPGCEWIGSDSTFTATLEYYDGDWHLSVDKAAFGEVFMVMWTAAGSSPTGTHTYTTSTWSGACSALAAIIV